MDGVPVDPVVPPMLATLSSISGRREEDLSQKNENNDEGGFFSDLWDEITDFGESTINWINGDGFKTDEDIAIDSYFTSDEFKNKQDSNMAEWVMDKTEKLSNDQLSNLDPTEKEFIMNQAALTDMSEMDTLMLKYKMMPDQLTLNEARILSETVSSLIKDASYEAKVAEKYNQTYLTDVPLGGGYVDQKKVEQAEEAKKKLQELGLDLQQCSDSDQARQMEQLYNKFKEDQMNGVVTDETLDAFINLYGGASALKTLGKKILNKAGQTTGKNLAEKAGELVDDFISSAGELEKLSGGAKQGFIKGNAQKIYQELIKNGQHIRDNLYKLKDGTMINLHKSTTTGVTTIDINKAGEIFKIRIKP